MKKVNKRRSAPGLEWLILRKLPYALAAGTFIPIFMVLLSRIDAVAALADDSERLAANMGILAVAMVLTIWTAALTVAIGCVMVWIMKGPTYEADSYPLEDSEEPWEDDESKR